MTSLLRTRRARWAVPAAAVTAVAAAIGGGVLLAGASSPDLPEKTPIELIADVHAAEPQPFSGTIVQTSRLGLPDLPALAGDRDQTSLLSMLTGSNTARVWYSSLDQVRFALMGTFDETNVIRNGDDVWVWSSSTNTTEHLTLPPGLAADEFAVPDKPITPPEAAALALGAITATTEVTVDGTAEIAGRSAYELVVAPRDDRSLIEDIRLYVDAETSMPLRFEVNSRGGDDPAFEVGFTSVTFTEPSADVFRFNPPPGAEVNELSVADLFVFEQDKHEGRENLLSGAPTVAGDGWLSVLVLPGVNLPSDVDDTGMVDALLGAGTVVSGSYGTGMLFETALLSVLWLDDGTLLAGAVTPDTLESIAEEGQW